MVPTEEQRFAKELERLTRQELRELVMVNTYKIAMVRNQLDAVVDLLIKKNLTTYEEVWRHTQERFQENTLEQSPTPRRGAR